MFTLLAEEGASLLAGRAHRLPVSRQPAEKGGREDAQHLRFQREALRSPIIVESLHATCKEKF